MPPKRSRFVVCDDTSDDTSDNESHSSDYESAVYTSSPSTSSCSGSTSPSSSSTTSTAHSILPLLIESLRSRDQFQVLSRHEQNSVISNVVNYYSSEGTEHSRTLQLYNVQRLLDDAMTPVTVGLHERMNCCNICQRNGGKLHQHQCTRCSLPFHRCYNHRINTVRVQPFCKTCSESSFGARKRPDPATPVTTCAMCHQLDENSEPQRLMTLRQCVKCNSSFTLCQRHGATAPHALSDQCLRCASLEQLLLPRTPEYKECSNCHWQIRSTEREVKCLMCSTSLHSTCDPNRRRICNSCQLCNGLMPCVCSATALLTVAHACSRADAHSVTSTHAARVAKITSSKGTPLCVLHAGTDAMSVAQRIPNAHRAFMNFHSEFQHFTNCLTCIFAVFARLVNSQIHARSVAARASTFFHLTLPRNRLICKNSFTTISICLSLTVERSTSSLPSCQ